MSLPPALLARLAQRGLVQQKSKDSSESKNVQQTENEEVIAEDYDEMEQDHGPEIYPEHSVTQRKRPAEENFWLERIKARMGESTSAAGYKGCPNKYNIWHKCSLYCVNRWEEGHPEPSREYMRRYKRLLRKYPLPKGWTEMYDPGCGCFYFYSATENLVSWLPPTHPTSQVTKSAAVLRRQLEDEATNTGGNEDSDGEKEENKTEESAATRHQREVDEIISASMPQRDYRGSEDAENNAPRKQKSRDLDRIISRQRDRERGDRGRDRDYERERDRNRDRGNYGGGGSSRRNYGREDPDILDPMDPSAYSDTPRGKWSSGLNAANEERSQKSAGGDSGSGRDRDRRNRERRNTRSDDDDDDYH